MLVVGSDLLHFDIFRGAAEQFCDMPLVPGPRQYQCRCCPHVLGDVATRRCCCTQCCSHHSPSRKECHSVCRASSFKLKFSSDAQSECGGTTPGQWPNMHALGGTQAHTLNATATQLSQ